MHTGQHHDGSPSDGAQRQQALNIANKFMSAFNTEPVDVSSIPNGHHVQPRGCTGNCPTAQLEVSDDSLALIWTLGNHTWRSAVDPNAHWRNDSTDQFVNAASMKAIVLHHLQQEAF